MNAGEIALQEYARLDAEFTLRFQQHFNQIYIRIGGIYYNRVEWTQYQRERRRWARDDPTVEVPPPPGFR